MTKIKAVWNKGRWVDGDNLPMCSASERDEMFLIDDGWEFELPDGWEVFADRPIDGDYIEIVGDRGNGEELIGFACPVVFVLCGNVYDNFEDCYNSSWFHPSNYVACRKQDVEKVVAMQLEAMEDGCYGD